MTDAYAGQVKSAQRGIELVDRRALHVRDELLSPAGEVRWAMVTSAKVTLDGAKALLEQDGKTLVVELRSPVGAAWEVISTQPPMTDERSNRGTQMLAVRVDGNGGQRVAIDVVMQLDGLARVAAESFSASLASWPGKSASDLNP